VFNVTINLWSGSRNEVELIASLCQMNNFTNLC